MEGKMSVSLSSRRGWQNQLTGREKGEYWIQLKWQLPPKAHHSLGHYSTKMCTCVCEKIDREWEKRGRSVCVCVQREGDGGWEGGCSCEFILRMNSFLPTRPEVNSLCWGFKTGRRCSQKPNPLLQPSPAPLGPGVGARDHGAAALALAGGGGGGGGEVADLSWLMANWGWRTWMSRLSGSPPPSLRPAQTFSFCYEPWNRRWSWS